MNKKIRDALFILFIIFFIIITTLTSLYASGYKFNLSWPLNFNRLLQKTGMMMVSSKPSRAVIYLDGKIQSDPSLNPLKKSYLTTPSKLKNVLPDRYELSLELAGYWPYHQTVNIYSGETTFAEDIILFKKDEPKLILASDETDLLLSPDKRFLFVSSDNNLITLKTEESRSLNSKLIPPEEHGLEEVNIDNLVSSLTTKEPTDLLMPTDDLLRLSYEKSTQKELKNGQWLRNNKFFKDGILFDPLKPINDLDFKSLTDKETNAWYYDESQGLIYYHYRNSLNRLAVFNSSNNQIFNKINFISYQPKNKFIFLILNDKKASLDAYSLKEELFTQKWTLPSNGEYIFATEPSDHLNVYDDKNKTLYIFDETNIIEGPIATIGNINNWQSFNGDTLLYTSDSEIKTFNLISGYDELLTRRSEKINEIILNSNYSYLVFSSEKTINIYDFKNHYSTTLLEADQLKSLALDEKNNILYFWANLNEVSGVYKLNLR